MYYRKLVGERLYLSPFDPTDPQSIANWAKWMNDPSIAEFYGGIHNHVSLSWAKAAVAELTGQRFDIVLNDDTLIGHISLHDIDHLNRTAFFGIVIGEAEQRGKGYGTEAVRLILSYGFNQLNLNNIMLSVHADDYPAIACYKKIGFKDAGRRREWVFKNGKYVDTLYMDILAREFCMDDLSPTINAASFGTSVTPIRLLSDKDGVLVYKCDFDGIQAVAKLFETDEYKREITNYKLLQKLGIQTIKVLAYEEAAVILEDIDFSETWRLGVAEDLNDTLIAKNLAAWYFDFHEKGLQIPELGELYCEYDSVTEESITKLSESLPAAAETFLYIAAGIDKLRNAIAALDCTLTYNDFYWTNLVVRRDNQGAMMFDYNLLGKGFRYADMRNVCSSLSKNAARVFTNEYNRLYESKHKKPMNLDAEKQVDAVVSSLFTLYTAYEREIFPSWANDVKEFALSGELLKAAEMLFETTRR